MLFLLRDLCVRVRFDADRDVRPHPTCRMRWHRTEIFVLPVLVGFHDDLFGLDNTVVAFSGKLRRSGCFGNTWPRWELADNMAEPYVVPHVGVDIYEQNRHLSSGRNGEDRISHALYAERKHVVLRPCQNNKSNVLAGK